MTNFADISCQLVRGWSAGHIHRSEPAESHSGLCHFSLSLQNQIKIKDPNGSKSVHADLCGKRKREMSESYLFHIRIVPFNPCDKHAGGIHQFR